MSTGHDVLDFSQFQADPYGLDENVLREIYGLVPRHYRTPAPTRYHALELMEGVLAYTNSICPRDLERSYMPGHLMTLRELCKCLSTHIPREFFPLQGSENHRFFTGLISFLRRYLTRAYSSPQHPSLRKKEAAEPSSIPTEHVSQWSAAIRGQGDSSQTSQIVNDSMAIKPKTERQGEGLQNTEKKNEEHPPTATPTGKVAKKRKKSLAAGDSVNTGKHETTAEGSSPARKKHRKVEKQRKDDLQREEDEKQKEFREKQEKKERKEKVKEEGKKQEKRKGKAEETSKATSQEHKTSVGAAGQRGGTKATAKQVRHINDFLNEDTKPESVKSRSSGHQKSKSRLPARRWSYPTEETVEESSSSSSSSEQDSEIEEDEEPAKQRRAPQNVYKIMYLDSQEEVRFLQALLEEGAGLTRHDIKACKVRVGRGRTFRYAFDMVFRPREGQQKAPRTTA